MPPIHILFDLENLQPTAEEVALVRAEPYRLWVFRGPNQKKYDADLAEAWQPLGDRVQFVRCAKPGKNALDFHIAFWMGRIVGAADRAGTTADGAPRFIVVSNDGGFDALFEYVRSLGYSAEKAASLSEAAGVGRAVGTCQRVEPPRTGGTTKDTRSSSKAERQVMTRGAIPQGNGIDPTHVERIVDHLRAHPKNRPASRQALQRYIPTVPGNTLSGEHIEKAIALLEQNGVVTYAGTKISYKIPKKQAA